MVTQNAINLSSAGLANYNGAGVFTGVTLTQHAVLVGGASNAITSIPLTNGQLAIGSTGADPVAATLTAGTGISITNGTGSITITSTLAPGVLPWVHAAGPTQAMAIDTGYTAEDAGAAVAFTLPATAVYGAVIRVAGVEAGGWTIAQNAGQSINFGNLTTTIGVAGSLASTNQFDAVELLCVVANTTFNVLSSIGNITVV
jgi:hypothetical protein